MSFFLPPSLHKVILSAFDQGDSTRFFEFWDQTINPKFQTQEYRISGQKMEFYCRVYFATLPFQDHFLKQTHKTTTPEKIAEKIAMEMRVKMPLPLKYFSMFMFILLVSFDNPQIDIP